MGGVAKGQSTHKITLDVVLAGHEVVQLRDVLALGATILVDVCLDSVYGQIPVMPDIEVVQQSQVVPDAYIVIILGMEGT